MIELLRSLEWSVYGACPSCRQVSSHAPDCRLDRAIRGLGSEPTFTDKLRALCLPTERDEWGDYNWGMTVYASLQARRTGEDVRWLFWTAGSETADPRRWPTAEAAVDELYAEWVAKQATDRIRRQDQTPEPTVDEMAADLGLTRGPGRWVSRSSGVVLLQEPTGWYRMGGRGVVYPSDEAAMRAVWEEQRPSVDEMAREMGLLKKGTDWLCGDRLVLLRIATGQYVEPLPPIRRWPTETDAIRTLYREHKAKQADPPEGWYRAPNGLVMPIREAWPTDPSALAAWLYARVVPGRTVAEVRFPDEGPESKFVVDRVDLWPDDGRVTVTSADKSTMAGTEAITRLLNPDGSVLWEAP